ncbi:MAG TPA: methyltransferase domain-containing protein [Ktedonosporobacter sp.]|nr:methyltransferase domain-containing protein [Ktedonosporobacter sp.]
MSQPADPRRELANAYFVQDRSNQEEMSRLHIQSQMLTASLGGVLPEQPDPARFQRVLDVGCGTGEWLLEVAKTYPSISLLIGVDANKRMVEYARNQAQAQGVSDHVEFHVMDALRMLEFPSAFFDLVNQRFGFSFVRTWEWPKLLDEYQRVVKFDGVVRITEPDIVAQSSSPSMWRLGQIQLQAFHQAGYLFTLEGSAVMDQLAHLLYQYGRLQKVQTRAYTVEYRPETVQGQRFYEDMKRLFRTALPFYRKWTRVPDDYETLYQQVLSEMQQPDFVANVHLLTAWGTRSS